MLQRALEQDAVIVSALGYGLTGGDDGQVGLMVGVQESLLRHPRSLHVFAEMRETAQKELVVVGVSVPTLRDSSESPSVRLANEGRKLGVLKVLGDDLDFELAGLEDSPCSSVRLPAHNVTEFQVG